MIGRIRSWFSESRAADYTTQRLAAGLAAAQGLDGVRGSGSYVACLNFVSDSTATATLTGEHAASLQPHLAAIARGLVDEGESTFELAVSAGGRLLLLPCSISDVRGTALPDTWTYLISRHGPHENALLERPAEAVLSFRAHSDTRIPWRGRGALEAGNATGALLAELEGQLTDESRIKVARVISAGSSKTQRSEVAESVSEGGIVAISGAKLGSKDGASALSAGGIGASFAQPSVGLHEGLTRLVCGALGVPSNLVLGDGDGAAARESFRRFAATTINNTLLLIQGEWRAKIGELSYSLDGLKAADQTAISRSVGSRANAFSRLVSGGVEVERALKMAGLS